MVAARWRRQRQKRRWGVPVLLVVYVGYVALGAGVLQTLERPAEARAAQHLLRQRWELLSNHTCLRGPALQRLIEVSPRPKGPALPAVTRNKTQNSSMRTHNPAPKKLSAAWGNLSAQRATSSRRAPGFAGLLCRGFDR